eukprot:TRINITY_DN3791_c0_g2_i5.p1 TRINITY_DN3791_c0_g2~~TRINITY_DN3791_c0_g2_i5.p1  ORF type:complete len:688 (-),score=75.61 TRINITY_DN3791_c0_g2_i5:220-2244(-)
MVARLKLKGIGRQQSRFSKYLLPLYLYTFFSIIVWSMNECEVREWLQSIGYTSPLRKPPSKVFLRSLTQNLRPEWEFILKCGKPVHQIQTIRSLLNNHSYFKQATQSKKEQQLAQQKQRYERNKEQILTLQQAVEYKNKQLKEKLLSVEQSRKKLCEQRERKERNETLQILLDAFRENFNRATTQFENQICETQLAIKSGSNSPPDNTSQKSSEQNSSSDNITNNKILKQTCVALLEYLIKHINQQISQDLGVGETQKLVTPSPTVTPRNTIQNNKQKLTENQQWLPDSLPQEIEKLLEQCSQTGKQSLIQSLVNIVSWLSEDVEKKCKNVDLFRDAVELLSQVKHKTGLQNENVHVQNAQHVHAQNTQNVVINVQYMIQQLNQGFIDRYENMLKSNKKCEKLEQEFQHTKNNIRFLCSENQQIIFYNWEQFEKILELDCQVAAQRGLQSEFNNHLVKLEEQLLNSRKNKEKLNSKWQEIQKNSKLHDNLLQITTFFAKANKNLWKNWGQNSKEEIDKILKKCYSTLKNFQTEIELIDEESYFHEMQNVKYVLSNFQFSNIRQSTQKQRENIHEYQFQQQLNNISYQLQQTMQLNAHDCRSASVQFGNSKSELKILIRKLTQEVQLGVFQSVENGILSANQMKEYLNDQIIKQLTEYQNPQIEQLEKWIEIKFV